MSAALLQRAREAGLRLSMVGAKLRVEADAPPDVELLALLGQHKAELVALLVPQPQAKPPNPHRYPATCPSCDWAGLCPLSWDRDSIVAKCPRCGRECQRWCIRHGWAPVALAPSRPKEKQP